VSLKTIAVDGFSYELSDPAVSATVTLTGQPSAKCKAGGKGICKDGFSATIAAITKPPATIPDPGPYSVQFSATAAKAKADGSLVLRVDDTTGDVTATPQVPGNPPSPSLVTFHLKISAAGQTKAKGA
jgi:hypothetical protein